MSNFVSKKKFQMFLLTSTIIGTLLNLSACNKQVKDTDTVVTVKMYKLEQGKASNDENNFIGTISFSENKFGLLITPDLKNITPGGHGFHLHNNASCDPGDDNGQSVLGLAAGDHYDPATSSKHSGPFSTSGHLGDLPLLNADQNGIANTKTLAPRLKLSDLNGRTVMIHDGADNYSDSPKAGGGGARKYCGVVISN